MPTRPLGAIVSGHMISRRTFVASSVTLLAAPLAALAQLPKKVPRIGVLASRSPEEPGPSEGLRQGLRDLGYVEGQNVTIAWQWARLDEKKFPELATELVHLNVDVIVAANNPAVEARVGRLGQFRLLWC